MNMLLLRLFKPYLFNLFCEFCEFIRWILTLVWNSFQSVIFLLAGFDTTANTLTSSCFVLARQPEIQEKIYDLVMEKIDQYVSEATR